MTVDWRVVVAVGLLVSSLAPAAAGQAPEPAWTRLESAGMFDLAQGVALTRGGDVLVTGTTESSGQDVVTMRLSESGGRIWTDVYDSGPRDRGEDVAVDAAGNAYVVGAVGRVGGDDALVRKLAPDGREVWRVLFDKGTSETARSVAVASDGSVFVAGVSVSMNGADAFVVKFDGNGKELWSRPINVHYVDEAFSVAVDPRGDAVVAGRMATAEGLVAFARKFTSTGEVAWTTRLAAPGGAEARGVAVAADGVVTLSGTAGAQGGEMDLLVARLSADGDVLWRRAIDVGRGDDEGREVALDASGNTLVSGFAHLGDLKAPFVLKLDPVGETLWTHLGATSGLSGLGAIVVSADGARVVAAGAQQRSGTDFDFLLVAFDQTPPAAAFSIATAAPRSGEPVAFRDASAPGAAALGYWTWDFGDGGSSTRQHPTHAYEYGGTYHVTLTVRDVHGGAATATRTLVVDGPARPAPAVSGGPGGGEGGGGGDGGGGVEPAAADDGGGDAETPGASVGALLVALGAAAFVRRGRR